MPRSEKKTDWSAHLILSLLPKPATLTWAFITHIVRRVMRSTRSVTTVADYKGFSIKEFDLYQNQPQLAATQLLRITGAPGRT